MKHVLLALALIFSGQVSAYSYLPNKSLTPGEAATTDTRLVCSAGYPSRARNVTQLTKNKVYKSYAVDKSQCVGGCKIDHLIPLAIGGSNHPSNLWPHEYTSDWGVNKKTRLEVRLRKEVCGGRMNIIDAQACVQSDWTACYRRFYKEF